MGWEQYLSQFIELFHPYGYIYKPLDGGNWISAKDNWKVNEAEIIKAISCVHPKFYIGTRAGRTTRYGVLDIDANSKHHNQAELDRLLSVLADAGLNHSSLYRSSYSGGWHLYIFFEQAVNSAVLRKQLVKLLSAHDFDIAKGVLEIFPHPGKASLGMGLRLPLQPGWAWLDKRTLEVEIERAEMTPTKALEFFLDALESDANSLRDYERFKEYLNELVPALPARTGDNVIPMRKPGIDLAASEAGIVVASVFQHQPSGIIADSWCRGREFHIGGLSGPSQRSEAIFCLGHYFFYGDPSRELPALGYGYEEDREWAIRQFLDLHHNGHSLDINKGRADATAQITRAAHWRPEHKGPGQVEQFTADQPVAWKLANKKRRTDARKRIEEALHDLKRIKRTFTTVELQKAAGCSRETLYNHADIWRQDYEDLAEDFFAICTGEYNAVEDSISVPAALPSDSKSFPVGLTAARAVVFDLMLQSKRQKKKELTAVLGSATVSEKAWRAGVASITKSVPSAFSTQRLKTHLMVLEGLLPIAPFEEDARLLLSYLVQLRLELSSRSAGPEHPS